MWASSGPSQLLHLKCRRRLVISCRNADCEFDSELPICLVDEDIYRKRPTLIIATVDKFAALPWNDQTANLFNIGSGEAPPELIIQDELHLISGPLGTLTGLYETAIDAVCSLGGAMPKVVASTATIRRAGNQVRGIFDRGVRQFPPPGIDARDSYFAQEVGPDQKGTRLYLGLMAPGTSQTTLMVRTYAALLQFSADLPASPDVRDPYWTLQAISTARAYSLVRSCRYKMTWRTGPSCLQGSQARLREHLANKLK